MEQTKALGLLLSAHCYMARLANEQSKASVGKAAEVVEWRRYKGESWWSMIDWDALRYELDYWEKRRKRGRSPALLESELRRILEPVRDGDVVDTLRSALDESGEECLDRLERLRDFMIKWVSNPGGE
ncbi:MAG: hypothetical protein U1E83_10085 [Methylotetracoccus sp.]